MRTLESTRRRPAANGPADDGAHAAEIVAVLALFARSPDRAAYLEGLLDLLTRWSGCACAGVRVLTESGEIPYEATRGFSREHTRQECWLSLERDACACPRAIRGVPEPEDAPLRTQAGSYASSDLQGFGRSLSPAQLARFRGRCITVGFHSLAVVPLRHRGEPVGAIHVADVGPGKLTPGRLAILEAVAPVIAETLQRFDADAAHARRREAERALWTLRSVSLSAASIQEVLDASIDQLRREAWLPELLGASIVARDRRTGQPVGAGRWRAPDCPAREVCGTCPDAEDLAELRFEFVGRSPGATLPAEPCAAAFHVPFARNEAVSGGVRVCQRLARRDRHVEAFLETAAAVLTSALQRRIAEADTRALQQRLVAAERLSSMGALAAGVAHEVNNPLGYVAANVALARERIERAVAALPPEHRAALDGITRPLEHAAEGVDRVRAIVGDLKAFSRADDEPATTVALAPILDSCAAMARNEIRHRAQLLRDYGPVPAVRANAARLTQVFLNLLVNAAQAIPPGRAEENEIRISLRAPAPDAVVVEVVDTGKGIAGEARERLFEPFFTTKPPGEGTGLGLSICHGIVTALGGRIEVESEPGAGATFRVILPAAAAAAPQPLAPAKVDVIPARRGRVLVVDDEPFMGEALCELLGDDHDVEAVDSGRAALERLLSGAAWDVVLCDLLMPQLTGMEVYEEVARRSPELADRIVFVSGGVSSSDLAAFLGRVPNARLEKPIDLSRLRRLIADSVARAPAASAVTTT